MIPPAIQEKIRAEFAQATAVRAQGNEGKARVCARRAAGWAITAAVPNAPKAAFSALGFAAQAATIPAEIQTAAKQLTLRITPDHQLPTDADPLQCAERVINYCLTRPVD